MSSSFELSATGFRSSTRVNAEDFLTAIVDVIPVRGELIERGLSRIWAISIVLKVNTEGCCGQFVLKVVPSCRTVFSAFSSSEKCTSSITLS